MEDHHQPPDPRAHLAHHLQCNLFPHGSPKCSQQRCVGTTVGTIPKPQHPHRSQLVKTGKELIQGHDQFLRSALGGQAGEALDVCKQDAVDNSRREMGLLALKDSLTPGDPLGIVPCPVLPDIIMLLDVDLMEHHVFFFRVDVFFHLHGNMLGQHR